MATEKRPGENEMAEANALVNGDRQAAYGPPIDSYTAQALVWSGMLHHKLKDGVTLDADDVVLLLAAMKLRRQIFRKKRDNRVDVHGYMLVEAHIEAARENNHSADAAGRGADHDAGGPERGDAGTVPAGDVPNPEAPG